jgi:hypothetical protein
MHHATTTKGTCCRTSLLHLCLKLTHPGFKGLQLLLVGPCRLALLTCTPIKATTAFSLA